MIVFDPYLNEVNYLLLNYIKLHDKVFDTTTKFKKFKKTFFPIKFPKIKSELDIVKQDLNHKENEIKKLNYNKESIEEINLYKSLIEYINSLQTTINYFDVILVGLIKKSKNLPYSIDNYKNDYQIYNKSITVYRQIGDDLNQAFTKYIRYSTEQYVKNNENNIFK
jgi:hypothetical protein